MANQQNGQFNPADLIHMIQAQRFQQQPFIPQATAGDPISLGVSNFLGAVNTARSNKQATQQQAKLLSVLSQQQAFDQQQQLQKQAQLEAAYAQLSPREQALARVNPQAFVEFVKTSVDAASKANAELDHATRVKQALAQNLLGIQTTGKDGKPTAFLTPEQQRSTAATTVMGDQAAVNFGLIPQTAYQTEGQGALSFAQAGVQPQLAQAVTTKANADVMTAQTAAQKAANDYQIGMTTLNQAAIKINQDAATGLIDQATKELQLQELRQRAEFIANGAKGLLSPEAFTAGAALYNLPVLEQTGKGKAIKDTNQLGSLGSYANTVNQQAANSATTAQNNKQFGDTVQQQIVNPIGAFLGDKLQNDQKTFQNFGQTIQNSIAPQSPIGQALPYIQSIFGMSPQQQR